MKNGKPRIKICGLRDIPTIKAMDGMPVDEIGFVFAPSKRQVDPATAASLIAAVHEIKGAGNTRPRTVGVFVNPALEELDGVLEAAALDVVQLHGNETPELCRAIRERRPGVQVWKVFSIKPGQSSGEASHLESTALEQILPFKTAADAILLDAPGGGTGQVFQWNVIESYNQAAGSLGIPLYVAGGLHADNVQELLRSYAPDGIDVSSGVETDGKKDIEKMKLFVKRVLEA